MEKFCVAGLRPKKPLFHFSDVLELILLMDAKNKLR